MASFIIAGGRPLKGEVIPAGNKNAVLPMMAASLLSDRDCVLENVPLITDVKVMAEILTSLGAAVAGVGSSRLTINCRRVKKWEIDPVLATRLRASVLLVGPLLARMGKAVLPFPGGDIIGRRAIDTHLDAFSQLGVRVEKEDGDVYRFSVSKRAGGEVLLDEASVTATESVLMYAAGVAGETVIFNAASEPHLRNLAEMLGRMGAVIDGAGTNRLEVAGVEERSGARARVAPDHVEIGTWVIAAAVTGGELRIKSVPRDDLKVIMVYYERMGVDFRFQGEDLVVGKGRLHSPPLGKIQTRPWPGFPSDLMSPFIVLATQAEGVTLCHDWMYAWRMFFVDKLIRMGAAITICDPHRILVSGPSPLRGRVMESPDIRAGMSLVLAALCARGESIIHRVEHIDRGYPRLAARLAKLGAKIKRNDGKEGWEGSGGTSPWS
jgi:UDP-N-acetylglucosamine 1-carboxyvinyltransferase